LQNGNGAGIKIIKAFDWAIRKEKREKQKKNYGESLTFSALWVVYVSPMKLTTYFGR
jgi:hypothetical protein